MISLQEYRGKVNIETTKPSLLKTLFDEFESYITECIVWGEKVQEIVVKDEHDIMTMEAAKKGRIYLKNIRIKVEKSRKELKEESLREGQAIDAAARYIKAFIEPLENHLDQQENYTKYKLQAEEKARQIEESRRLQAELEEKQIQKEKEELMVREKQRLDNERMRKELEEKAQKERQQQAEIDRLKKEQIDLMKKAEADMMRKRLQSLEESTPADESNHHICPKCGHTWEEK